MRKQLHPPTLSAETIDQVLTWWYMNRDKHYPMWARKDRKRSSPWHYLPRVFSEDYRGAKILTDTRCGISLPFHSMLICPTPREDRSNPRCKNCLVLVNMDALAE